MAPPRPSDAYVPKAAVRGTPPVLPVGSSDQASAKSPKAKSAQSDVAESKSNADGAESKSNSKASAKSRKSKAAQSDDAELKSNAKASADSKSAPSEASESKKQATSNSATDGQQQKQAPARPSSGRKGKKMALKDILEETSDEESIAGSEHLGGLPVGMSDFKAVRVGTSLSSSHFYGATHRNKLTGMISMNEDRYMPPFTLVDLFGRKTLVMNPEELVQDEYLFRFEALPTRTWMFHDIVLDPAVMAQNSGASAGMVDRVLQKRVVDAPINTGLRSPLLLWLPIIFLMGMTGDQSLVFFSLVSTGLLYLVTHLNNTPRRFQEMRWRSLPLRLISIGVFLFQYLTKPENQELMAALCILSSIGFVVVDFITGDLRLLGNYRLLCTYSIIHELPRRVFVCRRHGAAHLKDVVGERKPISEAITGTLWRDDMSLIADLNGLLVELRRPALHEATMMHEEYQERCVDHGFLSVPTYTRDRPCFSALDLTLLTEDLDKIIEKNKKAYPLTWKNSTPEDNPQPQH